MAVSETAGGSVGSFGDRALSGDRWEDPWPKMARALMRKAVGVGVW